jgi:cysteine desulfurase
VDAVQAAGKIPLSLENLNCNAASLSAHKFHGPPGCGILYLKEHPDSGAHRRLPSPGHQERELRGGTENLPAIVGCRVAANKLDETLGAMPSVARLREQLEQNLLQVIPDSEIHGGKGIRLPNTISIFCPRRNAADLVANVSSLGVAISAGAACSNSTIPSHVIRAMSYSESRANSTLRISLSRFTTQEDVMKAAKHIENAYATTVATPL